MRRASQVRPWATHARAAGPRTFDSNSSFGTNINISVVRLADLSFSRSPADVHLSVLTQMKLSVNITVINLSIPVGGQLRLALGISRENPENSSET